MDGNFFQDDEENMDVENTDQEGEKLNSYKKPRNKKKNLNEEDIYKKELKKIIKRNQKDLNVYISDDDEEKDPYASDNDDDSLEYEPRTQSIPTSPSLSSAIKRPLSRSSSTSSLLLSPSKRECSPVSTPSPILISEDSSNLITESQIISYLKANHGTAKDLFHNFQIQIKQNPQNKEVIRVVLKKVAQIKEIPDSSGNTLKIIELKTDYKILSELF